MEMADIFVFTYQQMLHTNVLKIRKFYRFHKQEIYKIKDKILWLLDIIIKHVLIEQLFVNILR